MLCALVLLLVVPLLAACGGDATALDPIAHAADKTAGIATERFTMDVNFDEAGDLTKFTASGVLAEHGDVIDMNVHVPATGNDEAVDLEVLIPQDRHVLYMRGAAFKDVMPPGKRWVSASDSDPSVDIGQNDPTSWLAYLRAVGKVEPIGSAIVRGAETKRYRVDIHLDTVSERIPADQRKTIQPALDQLKRAGSKTIPMEVWVDQRDYVRRLTFNWNITNPDDRSDRASLQMRMDLFDFGAKIAVPHPTPAETISLQQLENGG